MGRHEQCKSLADAEAMADFCRLYDAVDGRELDEGDLDIEPAEYKNLIIKSLCTRWDGIVRTVQSNKDSRRVYAG